MTRLRTPRRNEFIVALIAVLIASASFVIGHSVARTTTAAPAQSPSGTSPAPNRCLSAQNMNDYQLNECLIGQVASVRGKLKAALKIEAQNLKATTLSQAWKVVNAAEMSFEHYVRSECLAEANPYLGGTIYPITFGFCEVSLYDERLSLVEKQASSSLAN